MSIYTLQRKSRRFQAHISSSSNNNNNSSFGFSLNGGIRNNRPVGQTNLMSLKGETLACSGNDASLPKASTKNTLGYLYDSVYYPVSCGVAEACKPIVKGVTGDKKTITGVQSDYIKNKTDSTAACISAKKNDAGCSDCYTSSVRNIGGRNIKINNYVKYKTVNLSTGHLRRRGLPTPDNAAHFPMPLLHNGCDQNAATPAEAIAVGLLPADWQDGRCR